MPTYLVAYCPSNFVTVTASPDPGMDDKFLPAGWNMTGGLATTNADGSPSRTKRLVNTGAVGSVTVTATSGCSSKSVKIIVYQAIYAISADQGRCGIYGDSTFGHAWWQLSLTPAEARQFLPEDNYGVSLANYLGMGGYYGDGSASCVIGCPGNVIFGPQPIHGSNPPQTYGATGFYWWCISFDGLVTALSYVDDLSQNPGTYSASGNNCVTQAINVAWEASVWINYYGFMPCDLSGYLNSLPQPPICSCK